MGTKGVREDGTRLGFGLGPWRSMFFCKAAFFLLIEKSPVLILLNLPETEIH